MSKEREIRDAIRAICGGVGRGLYLVCEVTAVDGDCCTVKLEGGLELTEVRLTAVSDGEEGKWLASPKVGSKVLVTDLDGGALSSLAVVGYTHIERLDATVKQIELNGGENGGLVNVGKLKEWMQNVEGDLATLQGLLASSPIAGNGAPAAISFTPKTKSVSTSIEDDKITH